MLSLVSMVIHLRRSSKLHWNITSHVRLVDDNDDDIVHTGTAGVWRISALNEAGGWKDRTTVEDMDLAVRASLKGWKFVYLSDLKVSIFHYNP